MPKAKVNGVEVEFEPGMTVLQVAELAGEEIPRFCYHERLSIAGNCRMCLVEVKPGPPKPQASCALPAADNQEIFTNTPMVKKAREGVMEFLLINHPLDCPICDQGGECDLQDQAVGYGRDGSRFGLNKRAVEEKAMGPLINTVMTRCIQCTRCVRFISEVAGVAEIGLISRGEDVEITTYLGSAVTSELSGNVIDLCPVGALTSKPYAFNARPWELKKTETVDVMDAMGAAIRVDSRGPAVLRVLPRVNEDVNEEWISDKTRFAVDGLSRQRLDSPFIRENGRLRPTTWAEALSLAAARLSSAKPERIGAIAGDLQDAESLKATLDLFRALGSANTDCRQDGMALGTGPRESWLFNAGISGLEDIDVLLLVGTNPRFEAPVLNARLRRRWLSGDLQVGLVGAVADLTYSFDHLGETASALTALAKARSGFAKVLKGAKAPALIIGAGALSGPHGAAVAYAAAQVAKAFGMSWNVLHTAASRVGGLDMGFLPGEGGFDARAMTAKGTLDVLFLLGADEIDLSASDAFRIYLGSHGDAGAQAADLILPAAAYTEKDGLYVNLEGRVQMGQRAVFPKGEAREDWTILRALSERLGKTLPYDSLDQLRARLFADHPTFGQIDWAPRGQADLSAIGAAGDVGDAPLASAVKAFHLTNPVARASVTMAECAALAAGPAKLAAE
ncbi:MAG: NADH-quinone oxidoreductase subunit NuoG [Phenylobacterium sp.]|uniref:NADH-quinone oxidoreductase subunit NuoG n=1 Tax=Phenylobacterium sp. TaxID=1871053 RepID=UPI003017DCB5